MSIKYPDLYNTTYPNKVQEFEEKLNITPNDAELVKQIQQLIEQKRFAEANAIRQQIPSFKQKQIIAQDWNTMFDTTVALQREYDTRYTPSYILSQEKPTNQSEGDYWYRITDIKYVGETTEIGVGEKSIDNPYELKGQMVPNTNLKLYSLSNGKVYDEYNEQSKTYVKRIGKLALDGTQEMNNVVNGYYGTIITEAKNIDNISILSTRFNQIDINNISSGIGVSTKKETSGLGIFFNIGQPVDNGGELKQWFSTHPTTILYELAIPQLIQL